MDKNEDKSVFEGAVDTGTGVFHKYKAEFRKIVWPSRETLIKHTITVVMVSAMFGALIAAYDGIFGQLFSAFVRAVGRG